MEVVPLATISQVREACHRHEASVKGGVAFYLEEVKRRVGEKSARSSEHDMMTLSRNYGPRVETIHMDRCRVTSRQSEG